MNIQLSEELLSQVLDIIKQAGKHLLELYDQPIDVRIKEDQTQVTNADITISNFLTEQLSILTPQTPILSEENCDVPAAERQSWTEYWLIDPLDGTEQFIEKTDQFSILIALIQYNQPTIGIVYAPINQQTFYAMQGYGAYKQTPSHLEQLPPANTQNRRDNVIRIAVGNTVSDEQVLAQLNQDYQYQFIHYGSSGLKGCMVAESSCDCYMRLGKTGEWDTSAVACILKELGGGIVDFNMQELTYNQRDTLINPNFLMLGDLSLPWKDILKL